MMPNILFCEVDMGNIGSNKACCILIVGLTFGGQYATTNIETTAECPEAKD
jgi:hypothetical protein